MKWVLLAVVILATVTTDLLQSHEMKNHGRLARLRPGRLGETLAVLARRRNLILSVALMAVSFFAFLALLSMADLSFVVPATAASYAIETVLARIWLHETVEARRWLGALLVCAGVILIAF